MREPKSKVVKKAVRKFETGAFRDTDSHKLQFTRSLSPIVLIRYVEFMRDHNNTADGQRDEGNWKKGFTRKSYMESKFRHLIETWLIQDGLKEYLDLDPKLLEDLVLKELIESLCAEFFNTQGFLHVLLLEQRKRRRAKLVKPIKVTRKKIKKQKKQKKQKKHKEKAKHFYPHIRARNYGTAICGLTIRKGIWTTLKQADVTCETCKKILDL